MNKIKVIGCMSEIISLAKSMGVKDNTATTKLSADKPSRHSLATFTPTVSDSATGVSIMSSSSYTNKVHSDYDGLIDRIKYHFGNKSSRLITVVNTRCPTIWQYPLTKLSGAFPC